MKLSSTAQMCLQSCHRAVITDWACFGPHAFFFVSYQSWCKNRNLNKHVSCFVPHSVSSAASKHVTGAYEIIIAKWVYSKIKYEHYEPCDVLCNHFYLQGSFFVTLAGGHPFWSTSLLINISHPSHRPLPMHTLWIFFCFLNQSVGVKPDKPPGNPAARVLSLH